MTDYSKYLRRANGQHVERVVRIEDLRAGMIVGAVTRSGLVISRVSARDGKVTLDDFPHDENDVAIYILEDQPLPNVPGALIKARVNDAPVGGKEVILLLLDGPGPRWRLVHSEWDLCITPDAIQPGWVLVKLVPAS